RSSHTRIGEETAYKKKNGQYQVYGCKRSNRPRIKAVPVSTHKPMIHFSESEPNITNKPEVIIPNNKIFHRNAPIHFDFETSDLAICLLAVMVTTTDRMKNVRRVSRI